jgi:hypothetical protein
VLNYNALGALGALFHLLHCLVTGDPLTGREIFPVAEAHEKFYFTGFYMEISGGD